MLEKRRMKVTDNADTDIPIRQGKENPAPPVGCNERNGKRRRRKMRDSKRARLVVSLAMVLCLGIFVMGCATPAEVKQCQDTTQQAIQKADMAMKAAEAAKADCASATQKSEAAAVKAEMAADRAEMAAKKAAQAADKAEAMANKAEAMFMKKMKK
jgi:hypothetical protein